MCPFLVGLVPPVYRSHVTDGAFLHDSTVAHALRSAVSSVVADQQDIHESLSQVKTTEQTSEHAVGVGASRACTLALMSATHETILAWEDTRGSRPAGGLPKGAKAMIDGLAVAAKQKVATA